MDYKKFTARTTSLDNHRVSPEDGDTILRFRKSERLLHWALAVPFLVCFLTSMILFVVYNPDPLLPYRHVFSMIHKVAGVCLIVLPILTLLRSKADFKIYLYNTKQAWIWTLDDIKWLFLMGIAAINKSITLPEQGKFNAAEKINFMTLMATYPLYIVTGLVIWLTTGAAIFWIVHILMAGFATPLVLGHIYMAMINPDTRKGLPGMISGHVDREWAKHHYTAWYKEHFEDDQARNLNEQTVIHTVAKESRRHVKETGELETAHK